jgi:hypothetical protein
VYPLTDTVLPADDEADDEPLDRDALLLDEDALRVYPFTRVPSARVYPLTFTVFESPDAAAVLVDPDAPDDGAER